MSKRKRIPRRPQVQGDAVGLQVELGAGGVTDGAGLLLLRRVSDVLGVTRWLDEQTRWLGGEYRPALMVELWLALQWWGGGWMDDLRLLESRGIRRLFGWVRIPPPPTYGRWLRRAGERMAKLVDELVLRTVRQRWGARPPKRVMLILDSFVSVRYGSQQAGAEVGYNPRKKGRPSHHPLMAFLDTGDCVGVLWRPGSANSDTGAEEFLAERVAWLRAAGVEEITVRMDKGFFSKSMVAKLKELDVWFVLKMQELNTLQQYKGTFRQSKRNPQFWSSVGQMWGVRLLSIEKRERVGTAQGELELGTWEMRSRATIVTNIPRIGPYEAWRRYNAGAVVEHRIEELTQLSAGRTAVDDLGGNKLLWAMSALSYQLLHYARTKVLPKQWRTAKPKRVRNYLIRIPGRLVRHAGAWRLKLVHDPLAELLLRALQTVRPPPSPPPLQTA